MFSDKVVLITGAGQGIGKELQPGTGCSGLIAGLGSRNSMASEPS